MFIEPIDPAIYEGSDAHGTLVIHHAIENLIRRYPQHYHWSYKRFKANPELDNVYTLEDEDALEKSRTSPLNKPRKTNMTRTDSAT